MTTLAAYGVSIDVPAGWEAELSTQPDPATLDPSLPPAAAPLVVLHIANFVLPVERGDYGYEAAASMDRNGIFAALVEFDGASAGAALFGPAGVSSGLSPDDFSPTQLAMTVAGHSGLQRFFHVQSRAFCLYAVIGEHSLRRVLVPELDRVLASLQITPH